MRLRRAPGGLAALGLFVIARRRTFVLPHAER
jgi:hypothetical protein